MRKHRDTTGFLSQEGSESATTRLPTFNAFPSVLKGHAIQQLNLPQELLSSIGHSKSYAATTVKASNLAEVRAKLKAGKA